jgi:hypothetical protein
MTKRLPNVWNEKSSGYVDSVLKNEAARYFRIHQLPSDPLEWSVLKPLLREKIWQSLRTRPVRGLDLEHRETGSTAMDGYSVKNIYYQSRKCFSVTGNLYVPDGKGPFPGVLCMHGHWAQGRLAEEIQYCGHTLAKNGYVCLTVDAFGAGERATTHGKYEYHGEMLGASLFNIGETLMGIQLIDNMRGVDLLCSLDYVSSDKIGATGASGGGNQTMWLAAMDDRVAASVPVASVGTFEAYIGGSNCVCETLPGGLTFMEESAVLALAAPNAMKICSCLGEIYGAFFPKEMMRSVAEARRVFQGLGVDGNLSYQVFNQPHGYWPEMREAMLGWFDLHLRGSGHGAPKAETPFECLPEMDLMVFPEGGRDPKVVSIAEYCRKRGAELLASTDEVGLSDEKQKRVELAAILGAREALERKTLHRYGSGGGGWTRFALETKCGRMIPLIVCEPSGPSETSSSPKSYSLLAGTTGKHDLVGTQVFQEAVASGDSVAVIDLWGTGETERFDDSCGSAYHNLSRSCLWFGRTLMGEWVRDLALVTAVLKDEFGAKKVTLGGHKEAGMAALFQSALSEESHPVILEDSPHSLVFRNQGPPSAPRESFYSMALHLPDLLNWGDVTRAVSLAGEVRFINPRWSDGEPAASHSVP